MQPSLRQRLELLQKRVKRPRQQSLASTTNDDNDDEATQHGHYSLFLVTTDFEMSEIKAIEAVFPNTMHNGCLFHFSQQLFRRSQSIGLANLFRQDDELGALMRQSFRMVLSLALIPCEQVRRGFSLIVQRACNSALLQSFFFYFAKTYIGLTEIETQMGVQAFQPQMEIQQRPSIESTISDNSHDYAQNLSPNSLQLAPSTSTNSYQQRQSSQSTSALSNLSLVLPWELPIVRQPLYDIDFWNCNEAALSRLHKTNNAMEASHMQYQKKLNHHPSLSDFLLQFLADIDVQIDNANAARLFNARKRQKRYIIKEEHIGQILDIADFETDNSLFETLELVGTIMQNYVGGLRVRVADDEVDERQETDDEADARQENEVYLEDEDEINITD